MSDGICCDNRECTAFIRPCIKLAPDKWSKSTINSVFKYDSKKLGYLKRALNDANEVLSIINCESTGTPKVPFSSDFTYDLPGC